MVAEHRRKRAYMLGKLESAGCEVRVAECKKKKKDDEGW